MSYTISQTAKITGLSIYTIRYYDKEGLLPFIQKDLNGARIFKDSDIEWLNLICCLKSTGMRLKDIRTFISWSLEGDITLKDRVQIFVRHKAQVQRQIAELQKHLKTIDYKLWYYTTAYEAGTEKVHKNHHWENPDK